MSESEPVVAIENHGPVRVVRLNRPDKKNALSTALGWGIVSAIEAAANDDSVRVVALTGAGDAFCSGLDLRPSGDDDSSSPLSGQQDRLDELGWISRFPLTMRVTCNKPVIAGVNGVAVGAGLSLAMAADVRIASDRARFLAGYARAGTSPDGGLTWTLPQAIGYERAFRFLLEQPMTSAEQAADLGLVSEVVPHEKFESRLLEVCAQLAQVAPLAVRQTKRMLGRSTTLPNLEAHLRDEIANARRGLATEDGREAVQALMEKRTPVFHGR